MATRTAISTILPTTTVVVAAVAVVEVEAVKAAVEVVAEMTQRCEFLL